MKDLRRTVEQYLLIRRAQGSTVAEVGRILGRFCEYVDARRPTGLTVQVAVGFARARDGLSDRSVALRLSAERGFCRRAQTQDPLIEVPPGGLLKARQTRNVPYIYGAGEAAELLAAAIGLHPAFRGETLATLIGLMAATGIRTGEARALDLSHFNPEASTLRVPGKYGKIRLLPLHPSVTEALSRYAEHRAGLHRAADCPALLVSSFGNRLTENYVSSGCRLILERTSLTQRSRSCRPRLMGGTAPVLLTP